MRAVFPPDVEETLKEKFFGPGFTGYFVEAGANEPVVLSQTWHLEQAGWTGLLIEPQPALAERLRAQRRAKVYAVACSSPADTGKTMRLHLAGIHSSFDPRLKNSTIRPDGFIDVPVTTLDAILTDAGAPEPIDFLSMDIEGHELEAFAGFDFARWRPRLVLLEDTAVDFSRHRFMRSKGYRLVRRTGINAWYVPDQSSLRLSPYGRLQLVRKYVLSLPFRRLREALRRRHHGT